MRPLLAGNLNPNHEHTHTQRSNATGMNLGKREIKGVCVSVYLPHYRNNALFTLSTFNSMGKIRSLLGKPFQVNADILKLPVWLLAWPH